MRNLALKPLLEISKLDDSYTHVLFLNDIFTCPLYMIELFSQSIVQEADLTCGLDYEVTSSLSRNLIKFYDT